MKVCCVELVDAGISAGQTDTMEKATTEQLGRDLRSQLGSHGNEQMNRRGRRPSPADPVGSDAEHSNGNEMSLAEVRPLVTPAQRQKTYFSDRQSKGTLDVWWLYDDGGNVDSLSFHLYGWSYNN